MGRATTFIRRIKRKMSHKLVLHGYSTPGVERKRHHRRIREVERYTPPLDDPTMNIAPLDVEKPLPRQRSLEAIENLDKLVPFDSRRQDQLVRRGRGNEWIAGGQEERRSPCEPRRDEAPRSIGRGGGREALPPLTCA